MGKNKNARLPYNAKQAKCIPGRTGPTRAASQSGLKGDVGERVREGHSVSGKPKDENETEIRMPILPKKVLKRQSAFWDAPDNPEQPVEQD